MRVEWGERASREDSSGLSNPYRSVEAQQEKPCEPWLLCGGHEYGMEHLVVVSVEL